MSIILENVGRLEDRDPDSKSPAAKRDHLTNGIFQSDDPTNKYFQQSSPLDSPLLAAISRRADSRVNGFPLGDSSLPSADATDSSIPPVDYCGSNHGILRISSIGGHSRSPSGLVHYDSLSSTELHDMLLCFLFVVKHLGEEKLVAWWSRLSENELLHFFHILEICLHHFRYQGRRNIVARSRTDLSTHGEREVGGRAMTLPARVQPPTEASLSRIEFDGGMRRGGGSGGVGGITFKSDSSTASTGKADPIYQALLEANVATEVGLVVLDALGLFSSHGGCSGTGLPPIDGPILRAVFAVHLSFLRVGQSETMMTHVFAALRAFADNFSRAIFKGSASICGQLCHELLRCCGSRLSTTRHEACTLLYLLMRGNYKSASGKGMMRVHTQVMVAVSRMLGAGIATLDSARLKDSLSLIDDLASRDHSVRGTGFPAEVADLTQRVRTVLATMARMREHSLHDPEMLADMQHSLASSYASTPQLRHAWLHSMALSQKHDKNHSEGAMCQLHIAALIAEFLKQHKLLPWGADVFTPLSSNIPLDEMGPEPDSVETCADWIWMAERYELLGPLYRLILPIYEKKQQYDCLARAYSILARSCSKIVEVERSGRRLLGTYYRVAFYGKASPCEGRLVEYIYREPKVTPLAEISERLRQQHSDRHGAGVVRLVMESQKLEPDTLDPNLAYIQVTHVLPYFEDASHEGLSRVTNFDRNHDVRHFVFETPFVEGGGGTRSEEFHLQWKRRTILTSELLS
ncbi:hypothetical protein J437_LFUL014095 [Ladona fulva]|uniref:DOCKER domain-containing protein n=1 Tax=Ladona fulva TaxID=123851 RepID=A0A8K0KIG9_LADFU|nr:hypothetical protein J437_LFUL014095 [Ladona fulva]